MDQKMLNILKKSILYLNKQKSILFIIISLAIHLLSYQSIKKANVKIKSKTQPQENQINFSIREVIKNKVDSGKFAVAFILKPIPISALKQVADNNRFMPPKSTYIEPKLRSGLTIYSLD